MRRLKVSKPGLYQTILYMEMVKLIGPRMKLLEEQTSLRVSSSKLN